MTIEPVKLGYRIQDAIEPLAGETARMFGTAADNVELLSIALSLKRIADAMEALVGSPIADGQYIPGIIDLISDKWEALLTGELSGKPIRSQSALKQRPPL